MMGQRQVQAIEAAIDATRTELQGAVEGLSERIPTERIQADVVPLVKEKGRRAARRISAATRSAASATGDAAASRLEAADAARVPRSRRGDPSHGHGRRGRRMSWLVTVAVVAAILGIVLWRRHDETGPSDSELDLDNAAADQQLRTG
jgi:hypothetical protein